MEPHHSGTGGSAGSGDPCQRCTVASPPPISIHARRTRCALAWWRLQRGQSPSDPWRRLVRRRTHHRTIETAAISGGPADLLLTHEAPVRAAPGVLAILAGSEEDYPSDALSVAATQRERVQRVSGAVSPILHVHGHMHTFGSADTGQDRRVISLHRDTFPGNAGILRPGPMAFEAIPISSVATRRPVAPGSRTRCRVLL